MVDQHDGIPGLRCLQQLELLGQINSRRTNSSPPLGLLPRFMEGPADSPVETQNVERTSRGRRVQSSRKRLPVETERIAKEAVTEKDIRGGARALNKRAKKGAGQPEPNIEG